MRNIFSKKFIIIWLIITAVGFIGIKKLIIDDNNILTYKYYEDYMSEKELYEQANYDCPRPLFSKAIFIKKKCNNGNCVIYFECVK